MGFLQSIGNIVSAPLNALGNVTGVHIGPGGASISSPKLEMNDLLTLASIFAGPGGVAKAFSNPSAFVKSLSLNNAVGNLGLSALSKGNIMPYLASLGIKDPSKMNPTDIMTLLSVIGQGSGGTVGADGTLSSTLGTTGQDLTNLISTGLLPVLIQQLGALATTNSERERTRQRAVAANDPSMNSAMSENVRASAVGGARRSAQQQSNNMAAQGYDPSFGVGLMLGMINQANSAGNQDHIARNSPQNLAAQYGNQLQLQDPSVVAPIISSMLGIAGQQSNMSETARRAKIDEYNNRPPTFLESLLDTGGKIIPLLDQVGMSRGSGNSGKGALSNVSAPDSIKLQPLTVGLLGSQAPKTYDLGTSKKVKPLALNGWSF